MIGDVALKIRQPFKSTKQLVMQQTIEYAECGVSSIVRIGPPPLTRMRVLLPPFWYRGEGQ
jgi:hypothetical protein